MFGCISPVFVRIHVRLHQPSFRVIVNMQALPARWKKAKCHSSLPPPCMSPLVIGCISPIPYTHGMPEVTPRTLTTTTHTPHTQTQGHNPIHPVPGAWIAPHTPQPPTTSRHPPTPRLVSRALGHNPPPPHRPPNWPSPTPHNQEFNTK